MIDIIEKLINLSDTCPMLAQSPAFTLWDSLRITLIEIQLRHISSQPVNKRINAEWKY